jgi:hypothetical protein
MKFLIALMSFIPGVTLSVCSAILELNDKSGWTWFLGFAVFFLMIGLNLFDKKIS